MKGQKKMDKDIFSFIKHHTDCLTYAKNILGLTPRPCGNGQYRSVSFRPDAHNPTSLLLTSETWHDFGTGQGGDVIDLCAHARHNGNIGDALRELAPEMCTGSNAPDAWQKSVSELQGKIDFWHASLRVEDYEYLHTRRITDETIKRLKIGYSRIMNRIIVPYYRNGHAVYWAGRTLGRVDKGVNPKYLKAKLSSSLCYENCPWGLHTFSRNFELNPDYSHVVVVSEGMFDILSFEQEGFHSLSPIGGFFSNSQLPEVFSLSRSVDYVFVCNDSDGAGQGFNVNLCKKLFAQDIPFIVGTLPEGIKDVSDYYAAGGELCRLIDDATDGIKYLAGRIDNKDEFSTLIHEAAKKVSKSVIVDMCAGAGQFDREYTRELALEAKRMPPEKTVIDELCRKYTLTYSEGTGFYEYQGGVWKLQSDNHIKGYISRILGTFATGSKLASILSHMKARLSSREEFNTHNIFNFTNGILDLRDGKLLSHAPGYMSTVQADYAYDAGAKCPLFTRYIQDVMNYDARKILRAQELAGYILFPDNRLQVGFFLMGDGSNGKSVFIDTLSAVFGSENCSNVDVSKFGSEFEPIRLRHSLVNFCAESKANLKDAESKFKAIVTGDVISAAYKCHDAVEFRPRCKIVVAANNYISSNDISYGFLRRICFLRFGKKYTRENSDRELTTKLKGERAGIFNWVYEGYRRLIEQGDFTSTDEQEEIMRDFMNSINPVSAFVSEEFGELLSGQLSAKEIYARYTVWARESGNAPLSRINFTRTFSKIIRQLRPDCVIKKMNGYTYFSFGERRNDA